MFGQALSALGVGAAAEAEQAEPLHEASMNFDPKNVVPFIERLSARLARPLPANIGKLLLTDMVEMTVGEARAWRMPMQFQDAAHDVAIEVYMRDIDAPVLSFFGDHIIITLVNAEMDAFCEEMKI